MNDFMKFTSNPLTKLSPSIFFFFPSFSPSVHIFLVLSMTRIIFLSSHANFIHRICEEEDHKWFWGHKVIGQGRLSGTLSDCSHHRLWRVAFFYRKFIINDLTMICYRKMDICLSVHGGVTHRSAPKQFPTRTVCYCYSVEDWTLPLHSLCNI